MLAAVGLGLRLRSESWSSLGLGRVALRWRTAWRHLWQSSSLFAALLLVSAAAPILMAETTGIPERADVSGYNDPSGNLSLLLPFSRRMDRLITRRRDPLPGISGGDQTGRPRGWGTTARRLVVVASSILFGLVDYEREPVQMVRTGFMGLALGTAFLLLKRNL